MKCIRFSAAFLLPLFLALRCSFESEKRVLVEEYKPPPPACDLSGAWNLTVTVTASAAIPAGTRFPAVLTLNQSGTGRITGAISLNGIPIGDVTGTVSGRGLDFEISRAAPCIGLYQGTATVTESCATLTGSYSGADCSGALAADFASDSRTPAAGS
jgi:hypothetical protein